MEPGNLPSAGACRICVYHIENDPADLLNRKRERSAKENHKKYYSLIKEKKEVEVLEMRLGALNKMLLTKKKIINNKIACFEAEDKVIEIEKIEKKIDSAKAKIDNLDKELKEILKECDDEDSQDVDECEKKASKLVTEQKELLYDVYCYENQIKKIKKEMADKKLEFDAIDEELKEDLDDGKKEMLDVLKYHDQIMKEINEEEKGDWPGEPRFYLYKFNDIDK